MKKLFILSSVFCILGLLGLTLVFPLGLAVSSVLGTLFICVTLLSFIGCVVSKVKTHDTVVETDNTQIQKELEPKKNKVIIYNPKEIKPIEFDIDKRYLDKFQYYISDVNSGDCRIEVYDDNFTKTEYKIDGKNYKRDLIPVLKQVRDILKKDNNVIKTNNKMEEFVK